MSGREKTILIVDDTPDNIEVLTHILKDEYRIKAALDGQSAINLAQKEPHPDMILLDIMMPKMDGYEVCSRLKSIKSTANIPIIFVTAMDGSHDEEKGLKTGAVDYITKPISPSITLARVKTQLELYEQRKNLELLVQQETEKRLESERLLLRQSRLAAMGEMMSVIMHQWTQPLSSISVINSTLEIGAELEKITNEDIIRQTKKISETIAFMKETMNDFRDYFKPDKKRRFFNLHDEVKIITTIMNPILVDKSIKLNIDIEKDMMLYGFSSEFKQVILNLISNAKDALGEKLKKGDFEAQISIIGKREGQINIIEVSDNGEGINLESIERIFDDYFSTKEDAGTGIGLSMSKMVIEEQMNGKIYAKNGTIGARFIIELPFLDE